jgi:arylsulfatase A-like enzyme
MYFSKNDFKSSVLNTLLGTTIIALILAAVDAIRAIVSFDYLFITVLDKLLLVLVSMLVYFGISIIAGIGAILAATLIFCIFRKDIGNQWHARLGLCLATVILSFPLVVLFYNSHVRFLFPITDHILDFGYILLACIAIGIISALLFIRKTRSFKTACKLVAIVFCLPLIINLVIHITSSETNLDKNIHKPNVMLIVIDTLCADHLGCYGYSRNTSPNVDMLAKEGVLFENAFAQVPWTLPSIMSIMTSLYPSVHELDLPANSGRKLDEERKTLAEYLNEKGYRTGAFVGAGGNVSANFHSQGFDFYDDEISYSSRYNYLILLNMIGRGLGFYSSRLADSTADLASYWLDRNEHKPFFLFVHCFDPHDPYGSPEPFTKMYSNNYKGTIKPGACGEDLHFVTLNMNQDDIDFVVALYDGEISFFDDQVGKLIKKLKDLGLMENTLIVLTSDHGEEFWEHGGVEHGRVNYDESIQVPLIIRHPSFEHKRVDTQAQLIDIMPTILDYLNIPIDGEAQGVSLFPLLKGHGIKELPAFSETKLPGPKPLAIRTRNYKFIINTEDGSEELYDLLKDPGELNNIINDNVEIADKLRQDLLEWKKNCLEKQTSFKKTSSGQNMPLDEKTLQQLKSLGYIE